MCGICSFGLRRRIAKAQPCFSRASKARRGLDHSTVLIAALAIGLIGIERGWKQRGEAEGERAAGLRTLAFSGLLGGIWGALALNAGQAGVIALALAFTAFTAAIALFATAKWCTTRSSARRPRVAAMLRSPSARSRWWAIRRRPPPGGDAAAALLLALKAALHEWLKRLTWEELRAGLILAAMTVILLPLVPDRELSPSSC